MQQERPADRDKAGLRGGRCQESDVRACSVVEQPPDKHTLIMRVSCVALLQAERAAAEAAKQQEAEQEAEEEAARALKAAKKQQSPAGAGAALSVVQLWQRQPCHWFLVVGAACLRDAGLSSQDYHMYIHMLMQRLHWG